MAKLNYLESIGYCKAYCPANNQPVYGKLCYCGAGRYCLQQTADITSDTTDIFLAYRVDSIFVDITTICEFTKMYDKNETPVFANDIIVDEFGNEYVIYWDATCSAYLYSPINVLTENAEKLDIAKTTVVGNAIIGCDLEDAGLQ